MEIEGNLDEVVEFDRCCKGDMGIIFPNSGRGENRGGEIKVNVLNKSSVNEGKLGESTKQDLPGQQTM